MEFDQYFIEGYGGSCTVEIFNGTSWISIYTNSSTTGNPHHSSFDITTHIQNRTNVQIRYKWIGNYSWFWILDNIKVVTLSYSGEQFTEQTDIALAGVYRSSVAWGDYNNDGNLDILLTGLGASKIYHNNGDNSFTEQTSILLTGLSWGSAAWGDYDNDGDLDVLLTGDTGSGQISKIYCNNGDNSFTEQTGIALTGVYGSSAAWGDYDNDGYLDILLTGISSSGSISRIYRNNGNNTFSEQTDISLKDVCYSSVAWGDYDNDGDPDILLTGYTTDGFRISKIYSNNDGNSFTEQTGITLTGVIFSSVAWGDYDNDGDLDVLLTGDTESGHISKIYRNNGDNSFTEQTGITLTGVHYSSVAWGDYDNDGDLDVLLTGGISKIYRNNGDNSFTEQTDIALARVDFSSAAWGDYDNDGDLDVLLTGQSDIGPISKIYKNNNSLQNSSPSVPGNLNAVVNYQQIQFTWDKSTDLQTPQDGLNYNLVISNTPGACDIVSPMSNTANGFRKVVQTGNRSKNSTYTLNSSLPAGTYYWGVQAIDNAYAGSIFATGTFTITDAQAGYLKFSDITTGSMKISWTRGNKEKCAVFINQTTTGLPTLTNNTTYIANAVSGKGTQAGDGWYCVYNGIEDSVIVSGLCGSNTYKIMVIEYSGEPGQETYLTCSNTTNPQTCKTEEQFTEQKDIALTGVSYSSAAWGDYDNDGDLDILLTGASGDYSNYNPVSKIYRNNGDNSFIDQVGISLPGVYESSAAWGDYDNDGDLDILLTGNTTSGYISKIYLNNGDNSFTEQSGITLTSVYDGSVAWGDYNNDGYLDILMTGFTGSDRISKIYHNNGDNSFTEQNVITLTGANAGSVDWGDYDNDGDLDILLTGYNSLGHAISKIYCNNGDKNFTEQTDISLPDVFYSSVAWGDYDNDGDLDILLTGTTDAYTSGAISKIYRNDGNNSFAEQTGIDLPGVYYSSVAWGDYDNDGDLDILLTGSDISKIYRNNGDNNFAEQSGITLNGVSDGSVDWGDYDNDGDLDILLTGYSSSGLISKIYRNNNSLKNSAPSVPGNLNTVVNYQQIQFSWDKSTDLQTPQDGLNYNLVISSTPGACDIVSPMSNTANGFRKVVQIGNRSETNSYTLNSSLLDGTYYWGVQAIDNAYTGSAFATDTFTITEAQATYLKFPDVTTSSMKISWIRGNKEKCAVFINQTTTGLPTLTNDTTYIANAVFGKGTQAGDGWYCVYNGTEDSVIVTGLCGSNTYKIMVIEYSGEPGQETYLTCSNTTNPQTCNTQEQFTEQTGIALTGVRYGSSACWGDYDNDSDLDVLLTGDGISKIYLNNGDNTFTEQTGIAITGESYGSSAWGDYDNDGDLDILLTGYSGSEAISKIYRNNGDNIFSGQTDIALTGVYYSSVAWGDYNNDGDLDILLTGLNSMGQSISKIYRNNGDNSFSEQSGIALTGVYLGSVAWGDYDNDGDPDILLTGNSSGNIISKIYTNNGNNSFTEQTNISLTGVERSSVAWGDYDNDGDLDILLTGVSIDGSISIIYRNNGDNSFSEQTGIALAGVNWSSVAWGDYDNDGDLDILLTGYTGSEAISKIYCNNGDNSFTEQTGIAFAGVENSSIGWCDYDSDGDLDILLTGNSIPGAISKIYRNNNFIKNNKPQAPVGLIAYVDNGKLHVSWEKAADTETPQNGLTYNLRIGTSPGGCEIMVPMSMADGKRTIQAMGNAGQNTQWAINLPSPLPENIYYSVQAIDNGFLASDWSTEKSELLKFVADFMPNSACQKNEIQFQDKSYSIQYPITIYLWKFTENSTVTTSSLQNPIHTFLTSGTHEVELTITNSNNETISRLRSINILPSPLTDFTASNICQGVPVLLDNTTNANTTTIKSWLWSFGDNSTNSTLEEPGNHGYINPGDYVITLKAFADNSCTGTISKTVTVSNYPVAEITSNAPLLFCKGDSAMLSVSYNSDYSYRWLLDDIYLTDADSSKYTVKLSGNYKAEVVNKIGNCKATSSPVKVEVKPMPYKPVISSDNYEAGKCLGETPMKLSVNQAVTGYIYQWFRNGVPLSDATSLYFEGFLLQGDYSLEADLNGCKSLSGVFNVSFEDAPKKPELYVRGPVVWYMAASNDTASGYIWYLNNEVIPGAVRFIYVANKTLGTYKVAIKNEIGCKTFSDEITIPVSKSGMTDFFVPAEYLVKDSDPFEGLKIYPNPGAGIFTIEIDNDVFGEILISIITEQGKDILSIKFDKTTEHFSSQLDLSEQSEGLYIINLLIDKYFASRKLVIE
ncbi:MAG: FG-GAP-like repeat-containing protein [Bacteroidia bacterium]|nr:FG-GAP-like repeat-containing protein [Bacteroidia bacterium]